MTEYVIRYKNNGFWYKKSNRVFTKYRDAKKYLNKLKSYGCNKLDEISIFRTEIVRMEEDCYGTYSIKTPYAKII